jgi:hypothetical protein
MPGEEGVGVKVHGFMNVVYFKIIPKNKMIKLNFKNAGGVPGGSRGKGAPLYAMNLHLTGIS